MAARSKWRVESSLKGGVFECEGDVVLEFERVSLPVGLAGEDRGAVLDDVSSKDALIGGERSSPLSFPEGQSPIALSGLGASKGGLTKDVTEGSSEAELSGKWDCLEGGSADRTAARSERDGHALGVNVASSVGTWPQGGEAAIGESAVARRIVEKENAEGFIGCWGAVDRETERVSVNAVDVGEGREDGLVKLVCSGVCGVRGSDTKKVGETRQNTVQ
jgi:hypothetical protein